MGRINVTSSIFEGPLGPNLPLQGVVLQTCACAMRCPTAPTKKYKARLAESSPYVPQTGPVRSDAHVRRGEPENKTPTPKLYGNARPSALAHRSTSKFAKRVRAERFKLPTF